MLLNTRGSVKAAGGVLSKHGKTLQNVTKAQNTLPTGVTHDTVENNNQLSEL
jgi:hypothetical protein